MRNSTSTNKELHTVCFTNLDKLNFDNGGSTLRVSKLLLLHQRPLKMTLAIKVVKINLKIIILLPQSKSVKQTREATPKCYAPLLYASTIKQIFWSNKCM